MTGVTSPQADHAPPEPPLQQQLAVLRRQAAALVANLQSAATALEEEGQLPTPHLVTEVEYLRAAVEQFDAAICEARLALGIVEPTTGEDAALPSLHALATALHTLEEEEAAAAAAERRRTAQRTAALAILGRIATLTHSEEPNFAPLAACQQAAATLSAALETEAAEPPNEEYDALVAGTHPLACLLQLVEAGTMLDDKVKFQLVQQIGTTYDPELGMAALIGRIVQPADRLQTVAPTESPPLEPSPLEPTAPEQQAAPADVTEPDAQMEPGLPLVPPITSAATDASMSAAEIADEVVHATPTEATEEALEGAHGEAVEEALEEEAFDVSVQDEQIDDTVFEEVYAESESFGTRTPGSDPAAESAWSPDRGDVADVDAWELDAWDTDDEHDLSFLDQPVEESTFAGTGGVDQPELSQSSQTALATTITKPAHEIAATLLAHAPSNTTPILWNLVWRLVAEDQLAVAYHLATALAPSLAQADVGQFPAATISLPFDEITLERHGLTPRLLHAVLLGRHVRSDGGAVATRLVGEFGTAALVAPLSDQSDWADAAALLLIAATMRPALLAPSTEAPVTLLHILQAKLPSSEQLSHLRTFCQAISDYAEYRLPLNLEALHSVANEAARREALTELSAEVSAWIEEAAYRKILYAPASKVWRDWLKRDGNGIIYELLRPLLEDDPSQAASTHEQAQRLTKTDQLIREIDHTDRVILRRKGGTDIRHRAFPQFQALTGQAIEFVHRWLRLHKAGQEQLDSFQHHNTETLRRAVTTQYPLVLEELAALEQRPLPSYYLSSVHCCRRAVIELGEIFFDESKVSDREIPVSHLLSAPLLAAGSLRLDSEWQPTVQDERLVRALLSLIAMQEVDWTAAHKAYCERCDHEAADRVIEVLQGQMVPAADLVRLHEVQEKAVVKCSERLKRIHTQTRNAVDSAVAHGLLREEEYNDYLGKLKTVELQNTETRDQPPDFQRQLRRLQQVLREIDKKRQEQAAQVRSRMAEEGIDADHPDYARVAELLAKGDTLTANEYIEMVRRNVPLPEGAMTTSHLTRFFPQQAYKIGEFYRKGFEVNRITGEMTEYGRGRGRNYQLGPVDLYGVAGPQVIQSAETLKQWFTSKRTKRLQPEQLHSILSWLGFEVTAVTFTGESQATRATFTAAVLKDKEQCPVAQYGSAARGSYRVLCTWHRPSADELLQLVGETVQGVEPQIILYFNRLTEPQRREIARRSRERARMFIILDDLLLLYLCGVRAPRLRAFFEATLPFTFVEPYTVTAGVVPPEMFYGRQRERDAVVDPMGSCFIYGGRQLGKTALLRHVERTFHAPEQGHIVIWWDLKVEGIGYNRTINDIWYLIVREMKKYGVIRQRTPDTVGERTILEYIEEWLNEVPSRRILLLLDEADRFLESDGKEVKGNEFQYAATLKGLMDRTDRRFKVVFAGLHNVQRTTHQENHPLAHYGDPICIGPLLENDEWREARKLVEQPLASIGYHFDSPDLVTLMLSQTNYYPSLIQLYCTHLLRYVNDPNRTHFDERTSPPYMITRKHINAIFQESTATVNGIQGSALLRQIRQRLNWTLQLDQRYEVIAHTVAYMSLEEDNEGMIEGFPVERIREESFGWWPAGFSESTPPDAFHALLDEMVGLGILRRVKDNHYALRSPNVVLLMGSRSDIERELVRTREPAIEYEPGIFRSGYRSADGTQDNDPTRRSPLTAQQESALRSRQNGVSIIAGCEAADLAELPPFLEMAFGKEFIIPQQPVNSEPGTSEIPLPMTLTDFEDLLQEIDQRQKGGTTLLLISARSKWDETWVRTALAKVTRLKAKQAFVRVVFLADPLKAWELSKSSPDHFAGLRNAGVTLIGLRPWHDTALRQWFEECGLAHSPEDRSTLRRITGNWPGLLRHFQAVFNNNSLQWQAALDEVTTLISDPKQNSELLHRFGFRRFMQQPSVQQILLTTLAEMEANEMDEAHAGALHVLHPEFSISTVHNVLDWADLLGLIKPAGKQRWKLDQVVKQLLLQQREAEDS